MQMMQALESMCSSLANRRWRAMVAFILFAGLMGARAVGQEYRTDPVDDKVRIASRITAQRSVKDAGSYSAEKAKVEEFFTQYFFPAMTRTSPEGLAEVGNLRYVLFNTYLWKAHPQFQRDLTELAYSAMGRIVAAQNPPYHPAVRYNALLVIGLLDEQYATDKPPKPLPRATKVLTTIVDRATTNQFPPVLILGAVIGLERHAQFRDQLESGAADAMTAALLKLVNHEQPIQEMDREAYAWLRLRAAGVLAQLGSVGPNNVVHDAIVKLIGEFRSLDDRTATAALLSRIDDYEGAKVDGDVMVEQLFELARDVGAAEAKRAEDFELAQLGGGMGFGIGRGERMMMPGPAEQQERFPRRHVLARLTELRAGLNAAKNAVADDDLKARIDEVLKAIEPARSAAANKDTIELNLAAAIRTMASQLERAAAPLERPAEEPAPTDEAAL